MDISNLLPILNLFNQNLSSNNFQNEQNNTNNFSNNNSSILSYYPTYNIDGKSVNTVQNQQGQNQLNPTMQNQNIFSNPEMLINLVSTLAQNSSKNSANPILTTMQTFLNGNKTKKQNNNEKAMKSKESQIEKLKQVDDIEINNN